MRDADCVRFLQWALPRLRLRWPGFRRVRGQVGKRLARRLRDLSLPDLDSYRAFLEAHPGEWEHLDGLCRITISRFWRDRSVFDCLLRRVLPELAAGESEIRAWSIGCGAGEEVYSLAILWRLLLEPLFPGVAFRIIGTDSDEHQLARARAACYPAGSLKEAPETFGLAFERRAGRFCVRPEFQAGVEFLRQDIRRERPGGPFQLVLCRNLAFTYFDAALQREIAGVIGDRLLPGGVLVLGKHEVLPAGAQGFSELDARLRLYRKSPSQILSAPLLGGA